MDRRGRFASADVAITDLQTTGVGRTENATFIHLAGQRDRAAGADRVQAIGVAQVPGVDDGLQIVHHGQRAECAHRLKLGAIHLFQAIPGRAGFEATRDRAAIAGAMPVLVPIGHQYAGEVVCV